MTLEEYKNQHATLCANVAAKGAEIERLRAALELIAGSSSDKLQVLQARAALDNIGANVVFSSLTKDSK